MAFSLQGILVEIWKPSGIPTLKQFVWADTGKSHGIESFDD
jgi:hypothetical protein